MAQRTLEWISQANQQTSLGHEVMSFQEYMNLLEQRPLKECRTSYQYLTDMINYYGRSEENGAWNAFLSEGHDSPPVFGQVEAQSQILQNLKNFADEGLSNKFILLIGPNGSSKSSLVRQLMKGAESYSHTPEGELFTFSWIFPIDNYVRGQLGVHASPAQRDLESYAHLEDKDISAILAPELKDHPVLLIPSSQRKEVLNDLLKDSPQEREVLERTYFFNGDLSHRNRKIYDALLKSYKGDHLEVLKHIRVERFNLSKRYSSGAVTIEPQIHVDARMQQITMDKRLAGLPPSLQSLNLFSMQGELVNANRGVLEYSDLLKRPLDAYKYLLMTMETGNINLQGHLTGLDIFFIGTSNEIHLQAFKQHPDFNSFKGRFNFIKVPYLLNYAQERKIYSNQVNSLSERCEFGPHALSAISLFSVMTRIRPPHTKNYQDQKLAKIAAGLNPLEKAVFLARKTAPKTLKAEERQLLRQSYDLVRNEFSYENLYEGKFGLSPRDIKKIIYRLSDRNERVSFLEVLEYLKTFIQKKNDYDFLNMTPQGEYHHHPRYLELIKEWYLNIFDKEVRDCLGLIDDRSYEDYIKKYILNITAILKNEKIKNTITGKYETPEDYFIKEFEKNVQISEAPEVYRKHLISKLGAYSLDNPGKPIIYKDVFPGLVDQLKESFREEQRKEIEGITKALVYYENELAGKEEGQLGHEQRKIVEKLLSNLSSRYGHGTFSGINLLKFLIKERY